MLFEASRTLISQFVSRPIHTQVNLPAAAESDGLANSSRSALVRGASAQALADAGDDAVPETLYEVDEDVVGDGDDVDRRQPSAVVRSVGNDDYDDSSSSDESIPDVPMK